MNGKFREIFEKLKRPTGWLLASVYVLSVLFIAAALVTLFVPVDHIAFQIFSYVSYALAAIGLAYSVYTVVVYAPGLKKRIAAWLKKSAFVARLLENYGFRTVVFAGLSTLFNVAYAAMNGVFSVLYRSVWYASLAGYYGLLIALRGGIVLYHRRRSAREKKRAAGEVERGEAEEKKLQLKKYGACGAALIVLPVFLSFAILEMVTSGRAFVHVGWMVYAVAAYTFYKITMAIVHVFKARKGDDVTIRALCAVSLADAMVSMLALQTTLLYAFSSGGKGVGAANAITGGAVCFLTAALGVYMLVFTGKKRKEEREKGESYAEAGRGERNGNV